MNDNEQAVRVGSSPNGRGVYSLREFFPNELLGPIEGTVMDDSQYESDYCMALGDHAALEPAPPFRYINHSCHPNCELVEAGYQCSAEEPQIWVKVIAAIAPGEELTIDYAWPAEAAIPCNCGSPDCRHWIVSAAELSQVPNSPPR
jgi:uncharacterized protein